MKRLVAALLLLASTAVMANGRCQPMGNGAHRPECVPQQVPVLMYHKVTTAEAPGNWVVSPRAFITHLDTIKAAGYNTVTVSQLAAYMKGEGSLPEKAIAITFDDGWKDNLSAASNMRDRGMVGTFYLISGTTKFDAYLNEDDIREMAKYHEIGAHTHTHFMEWASSLDKMDNRIMVGEIAMSKIILETIIGKPVKSFAWPFGYRRAALNTYLTGAGYESAVLVNPESSNTRDGDPLSIQRLTVNGGCTPTQLIRLIETRKIGACDEEVSAVAIQPVR